MSALHARHVLVIEYQVPRPDRDAGSLRLSHMLRILGAIGHSVTLFTPETNPPIEYVRPLTMMGTVVEAGRPLEVLAAQPFDVAIVSREGNAAVYVSLLRKLLPPMPLIFDTVDLSYLRTARQAQLEQDPRLSFRALELKQSELTAASQCQLTWVVSETEQQWLLREQPDLPVEVLSLIYGNLPGGGGFHHRAGLVFLGGSRHPPNHDAVRFFANAILPRVRDRLGSVPFTVIGADIDAEARNLGEQGITVLGHVPDVSDELFAARVFVAPLRFGAGVKGKILHALSAGLPVVTTSVGAEGIGLTHGDTALLADNAEDFADCVTTLYSDRELWERLAARGREHVARHFSPEKARRQIESDLDRLCVAQPSVDQATSSALRPPAYEERRPSSEVSTLKGLQSVAGLRRDTSSH